MKLTLKHKVMLNHPGLKIRVNTPVQVDNQHDVPGLGGISKDQKIVYIDRHISPKYYKIVKNYILTRKALLDIFHLSPTQAKEIAIMAILPLHAATLLPRVKTLDNPDLGKIPLDLDTSMYRPDLTKITKRLIRQSIKLRELKVGRIKIYNQIAKTLDKDKKKEYYKRLSGGRKQWI